MKMIMIFIIRLYQICLSPLLGKNCRFIPTCSEYAIDAISDHGILKGTCLSVKRILKCHPFHPGGLDEVEPKKRIHDKKSTKRS
jgi:putative membrane protein insertion efficiency factor